MFLDQGNYLFLVLLVCTLWLKSASGQTKRQGDFRSVEKKEINMLREKCFEDLAAILHQEKEWIKVHAAEFLMWEGNGKYDDDVEKLFLKENELFGEVPYYRIGIWRVLSQALTTDSRSVFWRNKIVEVFVNPNEIDRVHAIESLAKLRYTPVQCVTLGAPNIVKSDLSPLDLYIQWSRAYVSQREASKTRDLMIGILAKRESINNKAVKRIASYILRYIGEPTDNQWKSLRYLALTSDNSDLRPNLLATLCITKPTALKTDDLLRSELLSLKSREANLIHFLAAIGDIGKEEDLALVDVIFKKVRDQHAPDYDADLHAMAAYTLLKMLNRLSTRDAEISYQK